MSEITREKFVAAWKSHVEQMAALVLQVPDAEFGVALAEYDAIKRQAEQLVARAADAMEAAEWRKVRAERRPSRWSEEAEQEQAGREREAEDLG